MMLVLKKAEFLHPGTIIFMLNQKTIVFKQWMYGSGSTAVASPRKPPTLVADIRRQHYILILCQTPFDIYMPLAQ